MFYENENDNEKDILQDSSDIQISEDGVVSWGDVLDDTSDDLVSVDSTVEDDSSYSSISSEDEIKLVPSEDEPDEDELRRILSEGDSSITEVQDDSDEMSIEALASTGTVEDM